MYSWYKKEQQHVISHFVSFYGGYVGGRGEIKEEFQDLPRSIDFFSKWDFLKFSGKLKITHYPFKIFPIIWFTNCVETKQISFIFL